MSQFPWSKKFSHADMEYLKQKEIGQVLAQGLVQVYKQKPQFPVEFLSNWLMNHEKQQLGYKNTLDTLEQTKIQREQLQIRQKEIQVKNEQQLTAEQEYLQKKQQFIEKFENCLYPEEFLQKELPNFLCQYYPKVTASYIGYLDFPEKPIEEKNEDQFANLDKERPQLIKYIGFSDDQEFLDGQVLENEQGITYDAFKLLEEEEAAEGENPDEQQEEGEEPKPKEPKKKYIYVPNVIYNSKMHYFRIPKLGAFLCVPMVFDSCLLEEGFDQSIENRNKFKEAYAEQQTQLQDRKQQYQDDLQKAQDDNKHDEEALTEAVQLIEEEYQKEMDAIVLVKEEEFLKEKKQYVVCVDTMGSDSELELEVQKEISELIQRFASNWENKEKQQYSDNIDFQVQYISQFQDDISGRVNEFTSIEDDYLDKKIGLIEDMKSDESVYQYEQDCIRLVKAKENVLSEQVLAWLKDLQEFFIFKYPQAFQGVLYFLGYTKDQVNVKGTNRLNWKEAKKLLTDVKFFDRIKEYKIKGAKPDQIPHYAMLNSLIAKLEQFQQEQIDNYNVGYGRVFRWALLAIKTRKNDVIIRRQQQENAIQNRIKKIELKKQQEEDRAAALETAIANFNTQQAEEKENDPEFVETKFNQRQWDEEWLDQNPIIVIPTEVVRDVDLDLEQDAVQDPEQ